MKKKVSQFAYGLVNYDYVMRSRSVLKRMISIIRSFKKRPKTFLRSYELLFGFGYLVYWILCIIFESPFRFWVFLKDGSFNIPFFTPKLKKFSLWLHKSYYHAKN